jgi:hypothetical protein
MGGPGLEQPSRQVISPAESMGGGPQYKVLLADDDAFSNLTLRKMVEQIGKYEAIPCFNGSEVYR